MTVQLLGPQRYNTVAKSDMGLFPKLSVSCEKKGNLERVHVMIIEDDIIEC